eukprot:92350-Pelagomonas_calceolata.AAC.1
MSIRERGSSRVQTLGKSRTSNCHSNLGLSLKWKRLAWSPLDLAINGAYHREFLHASSYNAQATPQDLRPQRGSPALCSPPPLNSAAVAAVERTVVLAGAGRNCVAPHSHERAAALAAKAAAGHRVVCACCCCLHQTTGGAADGAAHPSSPLLVRLLLLLHY